MIGVALPGRAASRDAFAESTSYTLRNAGRHRASILALSIYPENHPPKSSDPLRTGVGGVLQNLTSTWCRTETGHVVQANEIPKGECHELDFHCQHAMD